MAAFAKGNGFVAPLWVLIFVLLLHTSLSLRTDCSKIRYNVLLWQQIVLMASATML